MVRRRARPAAIHPDSQLTESLAGTDLGGPKAAPAAEDERRTGRVVHGQTPMCAATLAAPSHPRARAR